MFLSDKDCFEHVCICLHQSTVFSSLKLLQTSWFFFFLGGGFKNKTFFGAKQKNSINLTHPVSSSTVRVVSLGGCLYFVFDYYYCCIYLSILTFSPQTGVFVPKSMLP